MKRKNETFFPLEINNAQEIPRAAILKIGEYLYKVRRRVKRKDGRITIYVTPYTPIEIKRDMV